MSKYGSTRAVGQNFFMSKSLLDCYLVPIPTRNMDLLETMGHLFSMEVKHACIMVLFTCNIREIFFSIFFLFRKKLFLPIFRKKKIIGKIRGSTCYPARAHRSVTFVVEMCKKTLSNVCLLRVCGDWDWLYTAELFITRQISILLCWQKAHLVICTFVPTFHCSTTAGACITGFCRYFHAWLHYQASKQKFHAAIQSIQACQLLHLVYTNYHARTLVYVVVDCTHFVKTALCNV